MAVLEPKLAILDETDSGLDIDALKIVAGGVNKLKRADNAQLVITHYQRLLNYIVPDFVHVLFGRPHRPHRRQGTGAGTGGQGLRLAGPPRTSWRIIPHSALRIRAACFGLTPPLESTVNASA